MISLDEAVDLVWRAFSDMEGGEIYVKKIPSMRVVDLAKTLLPNSPHKFVGIRPGEKLHEQMIGSEDSQYTYEYSDYYKILPAIHNWSLEPLRIKDGIKVAEGFEYSSADNSKWMSAEDLQNWLTKNLNKIGKV